MENCAPIHVLATHDWLGPTSRSRELDRDVVRLLVHRHAVRHFDRTIQDAMDELSPSLQSKPVGDAPRAMRSREPCMSDGWKSDTCCTLPAERPSRTRSTN